MVSEAEIARAAAVIRGGGLIAFPTETVYGLGANALDAAAVAKIFELKGRPPSSPLIIHVTSLEMARNLVTEWPSEADQLARRYWPGPLTMVLPKAAAIPDIVTAGLPTVGVRVPSHPVALKLIGQAGLPIAAPSANRFGGLSPTTAEHVRRAFGDRVEVLDGGPAGIGIESTVVSLAGGKLTLLRPGMISLGDLEQASVPSGSHPSPGMHPRHYSPRTPLLLVGGLQSLPDGPGAFVWWNTPGFRGRSVRMPPEPAAYAARLYGVLHELDQENRPWIAVEAPPETPEWAAIRDRLRRAAG
jgi:L-threonylcarbamoyladenylate synthase